jgi:hypothetical protein
LTLFALAHVRPPSARVEALSFRVVSRLQPSPRPGGLRTGFLTKPRLHFSSVPRGPLHRVSLESDLDTRPYLLLREGRHCGVCPACSASSTKNLFSLRVRIGSVEDDHARDAGYGVYRGIYRVHTIICSELRNSTSHRPVKLIGPAPMRCNERITTAMSAPPEPGERWSCCVAGRA